MNPDDWPRVRTEYEAGLEASPQERAARLAALREAGEGELADEVGALWAAEVVAGSFLEGGPAGEPDPLVGTTVGPYRVLHRLGAGGMGAVYLAARADGEFRRRVALKLLKPGMDSEEILRRFRFERQILAALEHPHIARLLDGGTTPEGRPYFVLEAVFGDPLDTWCRQRPLPERLKLFATVCRAVQFAHQNLVVHRDLKPSNILVTAEGVPKLVDFGIAKLLNPELGGPTLVATSPVAGPHTPDYASPEQLRGERVTTATDIYSLGLLLSEIATGERPRRGDGGEPLGRLPAGDLGALVAKALRPAPADRYPSAAALADDLDRFLAGHPVHAKKGTTAYRARLFVRRHKVGVATVATALVAVLGFGVAMAVLAARLAEQRERAESERQRAESEKQVADEVSRFVVGLFQAADPYRDSNGVANPTSRELLQDGAKRVREELGEQPAVKARLLREIGVSFLGLGQNDEAGPLLEEAVAIARTTFSSDDIRLAAALNNLAMFYDRTGRLEAAEKLYRESLEIRRRGLGAEHIDVARSLNNLAALSQSAGRYAEAASFYEESLRIRRATGSEPVEDLAMALGNLAGLHLELGHPEEAVDRFREALEMLRSTGKDKGGLGASLTLNLGITLLRTGDCRGALPLVVESQEFFVRNYPTTQLAADASESFGRTLACLGRFAEAARAHNSALTLRRKLLGSDHPLLAKSLQNLAETALGVGDLAMAERLARQALSLRRRVLPPDHPDTFDALAVLADVLSQRGDLAEVRRLLEEVRVGRERILGADHPKSRDAREKLAKLGSAG